MSEISALNLDLSRSIEVNEIINNKVLSKKGVNTGIIESIYIHPEKLTVQAIKVNRGLIEGDHFIGSDYIAKLNNEGAVLNIEPVDELKGKEVYAKSGKKFGIVKAVKKTGPTNELQGLTVNKGIGKEDINVRNNEIREIGEGVMLNINL